MELMATYPDNYFDLAIVDPPYGIDINKSGRLGHYGGKGKKWDSAVPDADYFNEVFRVSKNQVIWGGNYFELPKSKCFVIWDKKQPQGVSFASCEYAWASFDSVAKTFYLRPQNADEARIHPTQKPVALYEWLLTNYAKEGNRILDTHGGSGSIAIACYNKGYDLTWIELDKDYHRDATERFNKHVAQFDPNVLSKPIKSKYNPPTDGLFSSTTI